ncbi:glyoxylate reductase [Lecanora helva]
MDGLGAGYDQVNVKDCTKAGIRVSNTPTAVDAATADTSLFLMLGALRGFSLPLMNLRKGEFRGKTAPPLGHDPEGKLLGILGMGGIGRDLKKKAEALGMKVQYHNRNPLPVELSGDAKYVGFEELLETSDVISVNVPLNEATRHMISTAQFKKMKDSVVIINTARGAVIDEAALVQALADGKVLSAGLDVYEEEPKIHRGLVENPHVLLLPHLGTWTVETQTKMELWNIDNVRSALETGKLKSPVPEQKDTP